MTNVHEKKPRKTADSICEICGKKIMYAFQMANHVLTHRDRELTQVQCDICGKWIKNLNTLKTHRLAIVAHNIIVGGSVEWKKRKTHSHTHQRPNSTQMSMQPRCERERCATADQKKK